MFLATSLLGLLVVGFLIFLIVDLNFTDTLQLFDS